MTAGLLLLALSGGIADSAKLGLRDQSLRFASSTFIVADWMTTVDGMRKGFEEKNPILGRRPSLGRVNLMIGAALLANTFAVPKIKNPHLRRGVWVVVLLAELHAVHNNRKQGCAFSFSF